MTPTDKILSKSSVKQNSESKVQNGKPKTDWELSQEMVNCPNCGIKVSDHDSKHLKNCLWNLGRLYRGWSKRYEQLQELVKNHSKNLEMFYD